MNKLNAALILLIAAAFEVTGDALVRTGLKHPAGGSRWMFLFAGALVLFAYGVTVSTPRWDFGRLLGLYVVFFFLIAQFVSWAFFRQPPSASTLMGGVLIVAGGLVIAVADY